MEDDFIDEGDFVNEDPVLITESKDVMHEPAPAFPGANAGPASGQANVLSASPGGVGSPPSKPIEENLTRETVNEKTSKPPSSHKLDGGASPPQPKPKDPSQPKFKSKTPKAQGLPPLAGKASKLDLKDPDTKAAMAVLGIKKADLEYPDEALLNTYTRDKAIRPKIREKLIANVNELIDAVLNQRTEIINERSIKVNPIKRDGMSYISLEKQRLDRAEERQKKEVEALILQALMKKEQLRKEKEHEDREEQLRREKEQAIKEKRRKEREEMLAKLRAIEEKEAQRKREEEEYRRKKEMDDALFRERMKKEAAEKRAAAIEEETKKMKRLEECRALIEKHRQEKQQKMEAKLALLDEKEERRLEALRIATEERKKLNEEEQKRREDALKAVRKNEKDLLNQKIKASKQREARVRVQLQSFRQERERKSEEFKAKEQEKLQRSVEFNKKLAEEREAKARAILEKEREARERMEEMERQKRIESKKAVDGITDGQLRIKEIHEQAKRKNEQKQAEILNDQQRKEERRLKMERIRRHKLHEKALLDRIEAEKKQFAAVRKARSNEYRKKMHQDRMDARFAQLNALEEHKVQTLQDIQKQNSDMRLKKQDVSASLQKAIHSNNLQDLEELRGLANKFGLDFDAIMDRAVNPKLSRKSISEIMGVGEVYQEF